MIFGDMIRTTSARLGDDPTPAGSGHRHYTFDEIRVALNAVQRLFVFLTLCLETTATFALDTATKPAFYRMMLTYSDWLLPLRVRIVGAGKLIPSTVAQLAEFDDTWTKTIGTPTRYSLTGFDLLGVYKQPSAATSLSITYARTPVMLQLDADVPEIPERYHNSLIDGAIPILRVKEGAQEWQKTLPLWDRYMENIGEMAEKIRARNREQGYDHEPFDVKLFDRSTLLREVAIGR